MIHLPNFAPQSVDRVDMVAYLDENTLTKISVIIVNGHLAEIQTAGRPVSDFQSLADDLRTGLDDAGFKDVEVVI